MATIKSYTDIEQSRKLAEILPLESADMHYPDYYFDGNAKGPCNTPYKEAIEDLFHVYINPKTKRLLPCWSLAALLKVMPRMSLEREKFFYNKSLYNSDYTYRVIVNKYTDNNIFGRLVNNPIDACYEMILKLHELNKL